MRVSSYCLYWLIVIVKARDCSWSDSRYDFESHFDFFAKVQSFSHISVSDIVHDRNTPGKFSVCVGAFIFVASDFGMDFRR